MLGTSAEEEPLWETKNQGTPLTLNIALEKDGARLRVWRKTHMGRGSKRTPNPTDQRKVDIRCNQASAIVVRADTHHAGHRYESNYRILVLTEVKGRAGGSYTPDDTTLIASSSSSDEIVDDPAWCSPDDNSEATLSADEDWPAEDVHGTHILPRL